MKRYKIYRVNYKEFDWSSKSKKLNTRLLKELRDEQLISLSESFTLEAIRLFSQKDYVEDMILDEVILIEMPKNSTSIEEFTDGFYIKDSEGNQIEYEWFMSSPSWQKKSEGNLYEGCVLFVKEGSLLKDHNALISLYKNITYFRAKNSEGNIRKWDIPKINARYSLGLSSAKHINEDFNFTVVKNLEKEITETVLHYNYDLKEAVRDEQTINVTLHDGMGLITPQFAEKLAKKLGLDYTPSWFGVRQYGLAVKGLLVVFDIHKYFNLEENNITSIKDYWNNDVNVENLDIIYTDSMAKWCSNFRDMKQYQGSKEIVQNHLLEYYDNGIDQLLNGLWITKYEKPLPIMTRANYQLLSNLALTKKDYEDLTRYTVKTYMDIFKGDYKKAMIMLGDIVSNKDIDEETGEIISCNTATSKIHELLRLNPLMFNDEYVHKELRRLLRKKMKEVFAGKIYIKGAFRTLCQDPVALMQHICGQEVNGCLDREKFYETEEPNEKIKTYSRNPLNHYAEVINRENQKNDITEKWMSHLKGLTVVNIHDLSLQTMSGADVDTDVTYSVDNEIIRDAVVEEFPVIFLGDGGFQVEKKVYSESSKQRATINGLGSSIGTIANNSTTYSCKAQILGAKGFYNYVNTLTELRDLGMQAIDAQKTGQKIEVPKRIKVDSKPYFFCYRGKKGRVKWDDYDRKNGILSSVAFELKEWCNTHFLEIKTTEEVEEDSKDSEIILDSEQINKTQFLELLCNRELEEQQDAKIITDLENIIEGIYKMYNNNKASIRLRKIDYNAKKLEVDKLYLEIDKQFRILEERYDKQLIASVLARLLYCKNRSKTFLYRFCWEGVTANLKQNSNLEFSDSFLQSENGDIEYLGKYYSLVKRKQDSQIHINAVDKDEKHQRVKSIVKRSLDLEVNCKCIIDKKEVIKSFDDNEFKLVTFKNAFYTNIGLELNGQVVAYIFQDMVIKLGYAATDIINLYAKIKLIKDYKSETLRINLNIV